MNRDIQTLIEEASKENHRGSFNSDSIWLQDQSFKAGANFALSLFKWNQVTDGYPDDIRDVLFMTTKGIIYMGYYDQMECQWSSISGERFYTISITKWMEKPEN